MDYLKKQYNQAKNDRRRRSEDQSKVPSSSANPARAQEPLRPATSKPAPPASPFDRLKALSAELQAIISSFKPPASDVDLEWQAKASVESPKLAFNSVNAPVHAYEDGLMKLLIKLDGVESDGDARIRDERKRLVRSVEAELSRLDEWKASRWQQSHERDGARDRLVPEEGPRLDENSPSRFQNERHNDHGKRPATASHDDRRESRTSRPNVNSRDFGEQPPRPSKSEVPHAQRQGPRQPSYRQQQRDQQHPPQRDHSRRYPEEQVRQQHYRRDQPNDDRWARGFVDRAHVPQSRGQRYDGPRDELTYYRYT